jgi:D-alanyl-D-alanine dipeptidase
MFRLLNAGDDYFFEPVYFQQFGSEIPELTEYFYVREIVATKLMRAKRRLPKHLTFKFYDCWRPLRVQEALHRYYIEEKGDDPGFVYAPVRDRENPPPHCSGGAVDLTLCDWEGRALTMGTNHDQMIEQSVQDFFEVKPADEYRAWGFDSTEVAAIVQYRRLLAEVLTAEGFFSYPQEWWHFDYGDRLWADANQTAQLFKGCWTLDEVKSELAV